MSQKTLKVLIILTIILVIALIGISLIKKPNSNTNTTGGGNNTNNNYDGNYKVQPVRPIDDTDHILGDKNAKIQIIIYDDFECPFCYKFYETTKQIKEEFGNKVAIVFRHYPLRIHDNAMVAAEASECAAEQGKFWEMYDKLFADNNANKMGVDQFKQDAADLGFDQAKFNQCLDTEKYKDKVTSQMIEGKNFGVGGTPTFFRIINAEFHSFP